MIQPLRRRHRRLFTVLAVLLPLAFLLALSARTVLPTDETAAALHNDAPHLPQVLLERTDLWPGMKIRTRVCADASPPTQLVLELQPTADLHAPEILVYWSPAVAGSDMEILQKAYLLGTLAGTQTRRWPLPEAARRTQSKLLLYSLGHQAVLATAELQLAQGEHAE